MVSPAPGVGSSILIVLKVEAGSLVCRLVETQWTKTKDKMPLRTNKYKLLGAFA